MYSVKEFSQICIATGIFSSDSSAVGLTSNLKPNDCSPGKFQRLLLLQLVDGITQLMSGIKSSPNCFQSQFIVSVWEHRRHIPRNWEGTIRKRALLILIQFLCLLQQVSGVLFESWLFSGQTEAAKRILLRLIFQNTAFLLDLKALSKDLIVQLYSVKS